MGGDGKWVGRIAQTAADGMGARGWLEMAGEKKPLEISELGCGRLRTAWVHGVAGNGWGEEATGDERAWLHGRLRMGNGFGELRGRLRTAWVQWSGWKWVGRRSRWRSASLAARTAADGKWVDIELRGRLRTAKKPLEISELGCADGCGRQMGLENCADGCGRRGCKGVAGNVGRRSRWRSELGCADGCGRQMGGYRIARTAADGVGGREWLEMDGEKKPLEISELGCEDSCGREMGAENCADGCGRRGCNGVAGNGWGEEAAGDQRAWLRGRLRTANGWI